MIKNNTSNHYNIYTDYTNITLDNSKFNNNYYIINHLYNKKYIYTKNINLNDDDNDYDNYETIFLNTLFKNI